MCMFNKPLQSHLDLLKPDIATKVQSTNLTATDHDLHCKDGEFQIGDTVFVEILVMVPNGSLELLKKSMDL